MGKDVRSISIVGGAWGGRRRWDQDRSRWKGEKGFLLLFCVSRQIFGNEKLNPSSQQQHQ
jgi:hypothetical protein